MFHDQILTSWKSNHINKKGKQIQGSQVVFPKWSGDKFIKEVFEVPERDLESS